MNSWSSNPAGSSTYIYIYLLKPNPGDRITAYFIEIYAQSSGYAQDTPPSISIKRLVHST